MEPYSPNLVWRCGLWPSPRRVCNNCVASRNQAKGYSTTVPRRSAPDVCLRMRNRAWSSVWCFKRHYYRHLRLLSAARQAACSHGGVARVLRFALTSYSVKLRSEQHSMNYVTPDKGKDSPLSFYKVRHVMQPGSGSSWRKQAYCAECMTACRKRGIRSSF